jgi:Cu+-exporting ATPase
MHPEDRGDGPGRCDRCGMAREPFGVPPAAQATDENAELTDMTRRLRVCIVITAPLVLLAMADMLPGIATTLTLPAALLPWIQLAAATPVVAWGGWPFFVRAWESLQHRHANMFTLIALGTGAAFAYSLVATIAPGLFPVGYRTHGGHVAVYFEAAAVIVTLVLLGQVLELRARGETSSALRALLDLAPKTARRIEPDGSDRDIDAADIVPGDRLRVRPGERVATDGIVFEGASFIDESMVTGESLPLEKTPGDRLTGGTVNGAGTFVMRAERVGADTVLAQIVRMVVAAQRSRAPIQRVADVVAGYFVPAVVVVAALTALAWATLGPEPRLAHALVASVAVLIIACPCAVGLATPMSVMVGVGRGALAGILIRDAAVLEALERVDTLVVDKTGTLTAGHPTLTSIAPTAPWSEADLLGFAAALERASEHPIGAAIVRETERRGLAVAEPTAVETVSGKGIRGTVAGRSVAVGSQAFIAEIGIGHTGPAAADLVAGFAPGPRTSVPIVVLASVAQDHGDASDTRRASAAEGIAREFDAPPAGILEKRDALAVLAETAVYVAIDGALAGRLGVSDPIKESTAEAVRLLRADGIRVVMATGDGRRTAEAVAHRLGISEVEAEILPGEKRAVVERLQREGRVVAMAGDGINDAPALAQADVGIAMGTGTDVAMESAGVTLVHGDLRGIARARRLSRATMHNIRTNLFFAFAYNALSVPIAAGALYPLTGLLLNPMIASAAMSLSSVSVIANALRLRRVAL